MHQPESYSTTNHTEHEDCPHEPYQQYPIYSGLSPGARFFVHTIPDIAPLLVPKEGAAAPDPEHGTDPQHSGSKHLYWFCGHTGRPPPDTFYRACFVFPAF